MLSKWFREYKLKVLRLNSVLGKKSRWIKQEQFWNSGRKISTKSSKLSSFYLKIAKPQAKIANIGQICTKTHGFRFLSKIQIFFETDSKFCDQKKFEKNPFVPFWSMAA
jgi:hypothetical protein